MTHFEKLLFCSGGNLLNIATACQIENKIEYFMENSSEYYCLNIIVNISSFSPLNNNMNTTLKYYCQQALNKKLKWGGDMKFFTKGTGPGIKYTPLVSYFYKHFACLRVFLIKEFPCSVVVHTFFDQTGNTVDEMVQQQYHLLICINIECRNFVVLL